MSHPESHRAATLDIKSLPEAGPRRRQLVLDVALFCFFVVLVAPFVQTLTAQGGSRYALTAAVLEQGTFRLDDYEPLVGIDRVELDGHLYSDKAPGQPLLGVPVLGVAELLGADPATEYRTRGNLGLWSQTLVFCTIPGAVLFVLLRRHASRHASNRIALLAAFGLSFSTMLLPFASHLYGHMFAACLLFAAWHLVSDLRERPTVVIGAGALAALATASEYPAIYAAGVIGLWVLVRRGWLDAIRYGVPHLIALPMLLLHNRLVFESNATGYTAKTSGGKVNFLHVPKPAHLWEIFFGGKGFIFTPIVILGVGALVVLTWRRREEALIPAAVFAGYLILQAGWSNPWGGDGPGPRYISTALPFLVVPITVGLRHVTHVTASVLIGVGVLSMSLATLTLDLVAKDGALIGGHLRNIDELGLSPTLFTLGFGSFGWVLHAVLAVVAFIAARRAYHEWQEP